LLLADAPEAAQCSRDAHYLSRLIENNGIDLADRVAGRVGGLFADEPVGIQHQRSAHARGRQESVEMTPCRLKPAGLALDCASMLRAPVSWAKPVVAAVVESNC
jgi:hypothetical protein